MSEGRWKCEECGSRFDRDKSGGRPIRFCGQPCYHAWNRREGSGRGRFPSGKVPWNKGLKGIHLSPKSEYKKGRRSENWLPVGSVSVRADKAGKPRAYVKVAEPNKWQERARINWEAFYGRKIAAGKVIHHKDGDTLNDAPANLKALTRAEHIQVHREDLAAAKQQRVAAA